MRTGHPAVTFIYLVRLILLVAEIDITRMSSKGQVVIPSEMRAGFKEGEKLVIIKANDQIIMKRAADFDKNLEDDIKFAKRTEEAWKEYEKGHFKSMTMEEFLSELKKL